VHAPAASVPIAIVGDSRSEMYAFDESQANVAVVFVAPDEPLLQTRIPTGN
jgi:hypothetical protein